MLQIIWLKQCLTSSCENCIFLPLLYQPREKRHQDTKQYDRETSITGCFTHWRNQFCIWINKGKGWFHILIHVRGTMLIKAGLLLPFEVEMRPLHKAWNWQSTQDLTMQNRAIYIYMDNHRACGVNSCHPSPHHTIQTFPFLVQPVYAQISLPMRD